MTHQEIIDRWNTQADKFNQWCELGEDEKLEWAMSLEREECAKVMEIFDKAANTGGCIASAIRARGSDVPTDIT
jgi:hypothetical protein